MRALWTALFMLAAVGAAHAAHARHGTHAARVQVQAPEAGLCGDAIQAAQDRHLVPTGLLFAIGQVESGRPDPVTHRVVPWPWTVQAQNQSYYFATKDDAVAWVEAAQARSVLSIDVGCMQINLMYHPAAFQNLDEAFDPGANADYAARFLVSLHAETGDWQKAAGLYHSQTLALAIPYAQRVEEALTGKLPPAWAVPAPPKPTMLTMLQAAWGATLNTAASASPPSTALVAWNVVPPAPPPPPRTHFPRGRVRRAPVLLSYEH